MADEEHNQNLEHEVNNQESKGFMKKAIDTTFNLAVAGGATALGLATVGPVAPIVAASFGGGGLIGGLIARKKNKENRKPISEIVNSSLKTYSAVNTVFYPMTLLGNATYPVAANLGAQAFGTGIGEYLGRSAWALTGFNGAFVGLFKGAYNLFDKKFNPKGIGKSIADGYGSLATRIGTVFAPGYILAANGIPDLSIGPYTAPTFAVNALPVGIYNEINPPGQAKEEKKPDFRSAASQISPQQLQQYQNLLAQNPGLAKQLAQQYRASPAPA